MATILVIDDNDGVRLTLHNVLEVAGYTVYSVNNAKKGLQTLSEVHVDLLVLDIVMPDKDGVEVMAVVRKSHPSLPVLCISGDSTRNTALYLHISQKMGARATLHKPFTMEVFLQVVSDCLSGVKNINAGRRS